MQEHVERMKATLYASGLVTVAVQRFGEVYRATLHRPARIGGYPNIGAIEWHPKSPLYRLMQVQGEKMKPVGHAAFCEVHGVHTVFEPRSPIDFGHASEK